MTFRKFFIVLFLFFCLFPVAKIYAVTSPKVPTAQTQTASVSEFQSIENIKNIIKEHTPDFIAKPLNLAADALENFRTNTGITSANKLISFIFQNKVVFYGILVVLIILLLRFIWNEFF